MMLLWFALIGVIIIVVFWLIDKMINVFDEQDRKFRNEIESRWYDEMDELMEKHDRTT